ERIKYAIRLPANRVLQERLGYLLKRPVGRPSNDVCRSYASFTYQAGSWSKPRRVIAKVEWHPGELYPRVGFIVTNMSRPAENVVAYYNKRGRCEQWIKEGEEPLWEEPLWKACLGVLAFCENGDEAAHDRSKNDARYDAKQTQDKLDDRRKNQTGASLCSQFADINVACKTTCEACQHWGEIRSPISLGYTPGGGAGHPQINGSVSNALIEPL